MNIRNPLSKQLVRRLIQNIGCFKLSLKKNNSIRMRRNSTVQQSFPTERFTTFTEANDQIERIDPIIREENEMDTNLSAFIKNEKTVQALISRGIEKLFPVQSSTYKWVYNKEDVVAKDRTGSGKTLAYSLPIIERLRDTGVFDRNQRRRDVKILVIVPTRELCLQVSREFECQVQIERHSPDFKILSVYGGVDIDRQISNLRNGVDVVVATPGRMLDLIQRGEVTLPELESVILDEVDEMLDMGFKEDIDKILEKARKDKLSGERMQYLLFSATMPKWVIQTANNLLQKGYHSLDLVKGTDAKTSKTIDHIAIKSSYSNRLNILPTLINKYNESEGKTIIFTETKNEANEVFSKAFNSKGSILHGDVSQRQREIAISSFREGHSRVMIATNIAARGLDINDVDLIIQVNIPDSASYIHRSGRTARAGKRGTCVVLHSHMESQEISKLESIAQITFQRDDPPAIDSIDTMKAVESEIRKVKSENFKIYSKTASYLIDQFGAEEALARVLYNQSPGFTSSDPNLQKKSRSNFSRDRSPYKHSNSHHGNSYGNSHSNSHSHSNNHHSSNTTFKNKWNNKSDYEDRYSNW